MLPFGKPTQVDVASLGVKPTNHAFWFLSVVPVLPPAGQPMSARRPVPPLMFATRIFCTSYIAAESNALWRIGLERSSTLPSGKRTSVIALGLLRQPPEAIVAYALAISSGEQQRLRPPSVSAGTPSSFDVMPSPRAAALTLAGPRASASRM